MGDHGFDRAEQDRKSRWLDAFDLRRKAAIIQNGEGAVSHIRSLTELGLSPQDAGRYREEASCGAAVNMHFAEGLPVRLDIDHYGRHQRRDARGG